MFQLHRLKVWNVIFSCQFCNHIYWDRTMVVILFLLLLSFSFPLHYFSFLKYFRYNITKPCSSREGDGFDAWPKPLRTYCYHVRCATLIVWLGGMLWPRNRWNHYHAQLGHPFRVRAIKGLFVCYEWLGSRKGMCIKACTRCVGLVPCCDLVGYWAQVPQQPHRDITT